MDTNNNVGLLERWTAGSVPMFSTFVVSLSILLGNIVPTCHGDCDRRMLWDKSYFLSGSMGYDLQLCCNVRSIWAAKLVHEYGDSDWKLQLPPALDHVPITDLSLPGSEFVLSQCNDGTISQGYVESRGNLKCNHTNGRVSRLIPSRTGFQNNEWYAMCYGIGTDRDCMNCSIKRFCTNMYHPNCTSMWLERQIVNVSNDSVTLIIKTGERMPFVGRLTLTLNDTYRTGQILLDKEIAEIHRGGKYEYIVNDLEADSWYAVTTCLHYSIPQTFIDANKLTGMPRHQKQCLIKESFRTLSSDSAHSRLSLSSALILLIFLLQTVRMMSIHSPSPS